MQKRIIRGLAATAIMAMGTIAYGQATSNDIPYQISFENLSYGTNLLLSDNSNGWYGDSNAVAVVTNDAVEAAWTNTLYPIPGAHTKVLGYQDASLTNVFVQYDQSIYATNMTVDFMIKPGQRDTAPDTNLLSGSQAAIYVDTNGYLNAWCGGTDAGSTVDTWANFTNAPVGTGDWARVTIAFDYATSASFHHFYAIWLNGVPLAPTNGVGFVRDIGGGAFNLTAGGTWITCRNQGPQQIQSFAVTGSGAMDDLVVTTNEITQFFPTNLVSSFTIIAQADANGTATPSSTNVPAGNSQVFALGANQPGYRIAAITTNGANIPGSPFADNSLIATNFTWANVQATGIVNVTTALKQFNVAATLPIGGNGVCTSDVTTVNYGGSVTYYITGAPYYRIATISVDGSPIAGSPFSDNAFTTTNMVVSGITTDITATATFAAQVVSDPGNTPYSWLDAHGLAMDNNTTNGSMSDTDHDGLKAWQEFVVGTDPQNAGSVLKVLKVTSDGVNDTVKWLSSTSSPNYNLFYSTNVAPVGNGWILYLNNIAPTAPTNTQVVTPPSHPAFYKVTVTN